MMDERTEGWREGERDGWMMDRGARSNPHCVVADVSGPQHPIPGLSSTDLIALCRRARLCAGYNMFNFG